VERYRAADPDDTQPEGANECRAADPVQNPEAAAEPMAKPEAEQLEPGGEDAPERKRADERRQRRVRRARALLQEERSYSRAKQGPAGEAGERERSNDQTLGVTPESHQRRKRHDEPIERGHAPKAA
jgi:hypothetical protein